MCLWEILYVLNFLYQNFIQSVEVWIVLQYLCTLKKDSVLQIYWKFFQVILKLTQIEQRSFIQMYLWSSICPKKGCLSQKMPNAAVIKNAVVFALIRYELQSAKYRLARCFSCHKNCVRRGGMTILSNKATISWWLLWKARPRGVRPELQEELGLLVVGINSFTTSIRPSWAA